MLESSHTDTGLPCHTKGALHTFGVVALDNLEESRIIGAVIGGNPGDDSNKVFNDASLQIFKRHGVPILFQRELFESMRQPLNHSRKIHHCVQHCPMTSDPTVTTSLTSFDAYDSSRAIVWSPAGLNHAQAKDGSFDQHEMLPTTFTPQPNHAPPCLAGQVYDKCTSSVRRHATLPDQPSGAPSILTASPTCTEQIGHDREELFCIEGKWCVVLQLLAVACAAVQLQCWLISTTWPFQVQCAGSGSVQ
jgi:hypothetical protein